MIANLHFKLIKQEAWYLQIKDEIIHSKKSMDKMSIAEILKIYDGKKYLCDTCNKELGGKNNFTLVDHITHLINPTVLWSCEDCIIKDMKSGNIIGEAETKLESWQIRNQ